MGKVYTTSEDLTSVANAIRAKTGSNAAITYPAGFVSEIGNISNKPIELKDVNFIDYDGTLLYSYTKTEAQALTTLPDNPSHTRLTAQGWNWNLAEIKAQLTADPNCSVIVGQMYTTVSGATEIDIILDNPNYLSPCLRIYGRMEMVVDWGDNTTTDTVTSSIAQVIQTEHSYANTGSYTIKLTVNSGYIMMYNNESGTGSVFRMGTTKNTQNSFIYTDAIQKIYLGNNTRIGTNGFNGCHTIKYITLPNTVPSLGSSSFRDCYSLKTLIIPNSISEIPNDVFSHCLSIKTISLPHTITTMNLSYPFSYCEQLQYVTFSTLITNVSGNGYTFQYCQQLSYIPSFLFNGLTTLGNSIFYYTHIKSFVIPSSITQINSESFNHCHYLKSLTIPNTVTSLQTNICGNDDQLQTLTLPNNITTIPGNICANCTSLMSVNIPDTVTTINDYAFYNCRALINITIPENVTSIGNYAFYTNSRYIEIHIKPSNPPTLTTYSFLAASNYLTDTKFYVPYSSDHSILEAYQTADKWSAYTKFMIEEPAPTE